MKRTYVFLAGALATAAIVVAVASAHSAHSRHSATVQLRHTSLGNILVNSSGRTLYRFTKDHGKKNTCAMVSGCSAVWPGLKAKGQPTAGAGVKASLLKTSGAQVTYAGHPLYTYTGEGAPGDTSYVGATSFGGTWYAVSASGGLVK